MIAVVIVTHAGTLLEACVRSVTAAGSVDTVIVVDNGARPATMSDELAGVVDLIRTDNRGYGAAANLGFARARQLGATKIALLNDDVAVRPGWVEPLAAALDAYRVGAAQPKLLIAGSDPARINSLGVTIGADGAGTDVGNGLIDVMAGAESEIALFTGGAVMFTDEFLTATGGFDRRWFLYYEDADLGARGRALGFRYRLAPGSVVDHVGGASTGAVPGRTRFLQERNRLLHAFRHADAATVRRAVWLSVRRLRHQPRSVHLRALAAGLAGAPGSVWRRARHQDRVGR